MRILLVSQMWPSAADPDLGSFLVPLAGALEAEGHRVRVAAVRRRGGSPLKHARLVAEAVREALRRPRPDVVFAHFLFPAGMAGLIAARIARVPLVVMAHGTDVENLASPRLARLTRPVVRGAEATIVNSAWLGERLARRLPGTRSQVIDLGVDLAEFTPREASAARAEIGWGHDGPAFLCVGSLVERKNVIGLADAFAALGRGSLAYVGDGPLRAQLEGRPGVHLAGRVDHGRVPLWLAACDVLCQPSEREPFGQAALEAMAMERTVVATTEGGPPEFVTPEAGILVAPGDVAALTAALERAAALPSPNPAARDAAAGHDVRLQARRMAAVLQRAIS